MFSLQVKIQGGVFLLFSSEKQLAHCYGFSMSLQNSLLHLPEFLHPRNWRWVAQRIDWAAFAISFVVFSFICTEERSQCRRCCCQRTASGWSMWNHCQHSSDSEDLLASILDGHACLCSHLYRCLCQLSSLLERMLWRLVGPQTLSGTQVFILYTYSQHTACAGLSSVVWKHELIFTCFRSGCSTVRNTGESWFLSPCSRVCQLSPWPLPRNMCSGQRVQHLLTLAQCRAIHSASREQQGKKKKYLQCGGHLPPGDDSFQVS